MLYATPLAVNLIVELRINIRTGTVGPAPPILAVLLNQMKVLPPIAVLLKFPLIELYVPLLGGGAAKICGSTMGAALTNKLGLCVRLAVPRSEANEPLRKCSPVSFDREDFTACVLSVDPAENAAGSRSCRKSATGWLPRASADVCAATRSDCTPAKAMIQTSTNTMNGLAPSSHAVRRLRRFHTFRAGLIRIDPSVGL